MGESLNGRHTSQPSFILPSLPRCGYSPSMPTATTSPHIRLDDQGRPWVDDTNVKVIEIVLDHLAYGWTAETIQEYHSDLSLAQVYAALGWYYDHQAEMDAEVERQGERLKALRAAAGSSSLAQRALRRGR